MGRAVKVIGFPHVSTFRDRHGTLRYRYRKVGRRTVYLHGVPGSAQFAAEYVQDGAILVRQEKTKAFLELPIHPRLKQSLDAVLTGQMLFLVTQSSVGFTAGGFGNWFRSACRQAGIADRSAHGLRKSAAMRVALRRKSRR